MPDGTSSSSSSATTLHEIKISELPVAPAANATDQLEANQAGTSRSITLDQVSTVVANSGQVQAEIDIAVGAAVPDIYAVDYGLSPTGDPAANVVAINQAIVAGAAAGVRTVVSGGTYPLSGEIKTVSNLHLYFEPNAVLKPVGWSLTGTIIGNASPNSTAPASIQSNITVEGLTMDFSAYPVSPYGTAQGGTANTITLAAGDPAISAMIVGRFLRLVQGTGAGPGTYAVTAYNAGTKVATVNPAWTGAIPDTTTVYQWGWNDNAISFGMGVSDVRIYNTRVYNLPNDMWNTGGSKAIDFEQGLETCHIDGVWCHGMPGSNCNAAVFVQGRSGTYVNGAKRNASRIMVKNVYAENCGAAVSVGGVDTSEDPTGNPDQSMVIIDGVTFKNCGHMPYRFVTTDQQKSGAITIFRAQNVIISNVNGYNESTYPATTPGYPTDYSARVGFGLTGPIGAVIWGWGRNVTIDNVSYYGNADSVIRINRCRAYGDDGGVPGPGQPTNVFDFRATNILAVGTFTNAVAVDSTASTRVSNANLKMNAQINLGQSSVCPALMSNMSGYTNSQVDIFDRTTATRVRGQIDRIVTDGNTIASFRQGTVTDYTMGAVALGGGALNNTLIRATGDIVAAPAGTAWGLNFAPVVQPSVTSTANYIHSTMTLADNAGASNFQINAFRASMTALGASTTLTFAMGFYADSSMTLATNNYGFYGNIAAATGRWNLYMVGTANNMLAGNTRMGSTTAPLNTLDISGSLGRGNPIVKSADFTVAATENWLVNNKAAATCTVTLPAAASFTGREIMIVNYQAFTVVSASANVISTAGVGPATAILPATAGASVTLVSDGTNWRCF